MNTSELKIKINDTNDKLESGKVSSQIEMQQQSKMPSLEPNL